MNNTTLTKIDRTEVKQQISNYKDHSSAERKFTAGIYDSRLSSNKKLTSISRCLKVKTMLLYCSRLTHISIVIWTDCVYTLVQYFNLASPVSVYIINYCHELTRLVAYKVNGKLQCRMTQRIYHHGRANYSDFHRQVKQQCNPVAARPTCCFLLFYFLACLLALFSVNHNSSPSSPPLKIGSSTSCRNNKTYQSHY